MEFLNEYIYPVAFVICLAVGFLLKNCTSNKTLHQFIPTIVALLGMVICVWDTGSFTATTIALGLISGIASTGLYEQVRNWLSMRNNSISKEEE